MTPAPSRVVSRNRARSSAGSRPSGSGGTVRDRISAQIWASARRSAPAREAATRMSSACPRNSPGISRVHLASCSATDLVTALARSPASSGSWSRGSARIALYSAAWPRVTRATCTSQAPSDRCPSARCPSLASYAASIWAQAAVATASACSIPCRQAASAAAGSWVASRSAR